MSKTTVNIIKWKSHKPVSKTMQPWKHLDLLVITKLVNNVLCGFLGHVLIIFWLSQKSFTENSFESVLRSIERIYWSQLKWKSRFFPISLKRARMNFLGGLYENHKGFFFFIIFNSKYNASIELSALYSFKVIYSLTYRLKPPPCLFMSRLLVVNL